MTKKAIEISDAYDKVKGDLIESIETHLKRIDRNFTNEDSEEIEFLSWDVATVENEITEIRANGTFVSNGQEVSLHQLLANGDISLLDAISILECLEVI